MSIHFMYGLKDEEEWNKMKQFIGKSIVEIKISKDKTEMMFLFDDGTKVLACTCGDCCSETWIEHVELPAQFPAKVLSCEEIEMNKEDDWSSGDCVRFYGYKITTDCGHLIIDYRNSSNGWYGGDIGFTTDSDKILDFEQNNN